MSPQFPPKGKRKRTTYFMFDLPTYLTEWEPLATADLAADVRSYQDRWLVGGRWAESMTMADVEMREAELAALEARILAIPAVAAVNDVCRTETVGWLGWLSRSLDRRYGTPRRRPSPEQRRLSA